MRHAVWRDAVRPDPLDVGTGNGGARSLKGVESLAEEGMTLVMITHEMNFARKVADRVVFVHAGRIHEMGPPQRCLPRRRRPS